MASSRPVQVPSEENETSRNSVEQNDDWLGALSRSFYTLYNNVMQVIHLTTRDSLIFPRIMPVMPVIMPLRTRRKAKCPMSDSNMITRSCDHNGGVINSINGDVKINIPKGAIKDGDLVKFHIGTDVYGPFVLPSNCQTGLVSPYYWIGVSESYNFQKPVLIEMEHFVVVTTPAHYRLLSCEEYDESYTMQPVDYMLGFKLQGDRALFRFLTNRLCSYCLIHNHKGPIINRIIALYLKPKDFQSLDHFTVEIWFSFAISYFMKRNEELYTKKGLILDNDYSYVFKASCDVNSKSYFSFNYVKNLDGWYLNHSLSKKIQTKEIYFYNHYTNAKDLHASEEYSLYPPRFIFHVVKKFGCTSDLDTYIMITLYNEDEPLSFKPFRLFVSVSLTSYADMLMAISLPQHLCDDNEAELMALVTFSAKVAYDWKEIGIKLGIPKSEIFIIDTNHSHVEEKCNAMFRYWLEDVKPPHCWCHFIRALHTVRLYKVVEEASAYLQGGKILEESFEGAVASVTSPKPTLHQLMKCLKDIPNIHFHFFILCLLSKESAIELIKDIRRSDRSKQDNVKKLCETFLKEVNPSWTKVYEALKEADCDDLADIVEARFLLV